MAPGYSISGIGNYGSDPAFLYALNSYNPNFMGTQSSQYAQYLQAAQQAAAPQDTTATTPEIDPTFKGSAYGSAKSNDGPGIGTALAVAGGAAALILAGYKGKGNPIEGVKQIWNSLKSKGANVTGSTENAASNIKDKIANLLKNKNAQTEIIHNGNSYYYVDGRLDNIVPRKGVTITTGFSKNDKDIIDALRPGADGLTLSGFSKQVTGAAGKQYQVILDKEGKNIIKIKNITDNKDVPDIAQWSKDNYKLMDDIKTFKWKTPEYWKLEDGCWKSIKEEATIKKGPDGKLRAYQKDGSELNEENTKYLLERYKDQVAKIGVEPKYSLQGKNDTFLYEYVDTYGQIFKYKHNPVKKTNEIEELYQLKDEKPIVDTSKINEFFARKENAGVETELKKICSTGTIPSGYKVGDITIKDNGDTFKFVNGELKEYKLGSAAAVTSQSAIETWLQTAANQNRINAMLGV